MPRAGLAQQLQVNRVIHAHAAGALHQRLDDYRCRLMRVLGQRLFHQPETTPRVVLPGFAWRAIEAVRRRHHDRLHQQWLVAVPVHAFAADGERAQGFAVIAVAQRDELGLRRLAAVAPVVGAHLQRHFDGAAAVVGVEATRQSRRCDLDQPLAEFDDRLMGEATEQHMVEPVELRLDPLDDHRMAVAEDIGPPGADRVDVALAIEIGQPDAFGGGDRYQRQRAAGFVVLHLRAGMPDMREGALHPVGVAHRLSGFAGFGADSTMTASFRPCRRDDRGGHRAQFADHV